MDHRIISLEEYRRMPWKNGRGFTWEIGRFPSDGAQPFDWRLSIAEIREDGPFSAFPGYLRIINTLEGNGFRLTVDGRPTGPLRRYDPFVFSGASAVESALLDGPIRDFNLIFNPGRCRARLEWPELARPRTFCSQATTILVYAAAPLTLSTADFTAEAPAGGTIALDNPGRDLARFTLAAKSAGSAAPCACLVELHGLAGA